MTAATIRIDSVSRQSVRLVWSPSVFRLYYHMNIQSHTHTYTAFSHSKTVCISYTSTDWTLSLLRYAPYSDLKEKVRMHTYDLMDTCSHMLFD